MADIELPDMTETMAAVYDRAESGTPEPAQTDAEAPSAVAADDDPQTEEHAAAAEETSDAVEESDQGDAQADEPAADASPLSPPARWSADDKAAFDALPREAQELVLKREHDVESHLSKRTQEISEKARRYQTLEEVLEPRRQQLAMDGMDDAGAVRHLFALSDMAAEDPARFIKWFAEQRGVDLESLNDDAQASDPLTREVRNELSQVKQYHAQMQRQQQEAQHRELLGQIEAVAQEKDEKGNLVRPHFEAVRPYMSAFLTAGTAKDLKDAYEQAVWANPEIRNEMTQAQAKAAEAKRIAEAKAKAAAAEKAASTRPRSSNGQFVSSPGNSITDTMSAVYDSMNG